MGDVNQPGKPFAEEQLELFEGMRRTHDNDLRLKLVEEPHRLREEISRWAKDNDVELVFFDPAETFDHAILGLVRGYGQEAAVVYDEQKVLKAMAANGLSEEEAEEWFEFNTVGAYLGEATPRFLIRPWEEEETHVTKT